jgi:2-(1,2-epoxy-1,2-dihydrophenyl)acetyl-CoA isomerase
MSEPILLVDTVNRVRTVTLNRPECLNALSNALMDQLVDALQAAADDPGVRAVVLTGAGRAFSSGGDHANAAIADGVPELMRRQRSSQLLREMSKPTIAAVNGVAAGAAFGLALAADFRVVAAGARFVPAFAPLGVSGDFGGSYFLSRLVGREQALRAYLLGEEWDATIALRLGVVSEVVPDDELPSRAMDLALRLAAGAPLAHAAIKRNFAVAERGDFESLLLSEAEAMCRLRYSNDMAEAIAAFHERRPAVFTGT